MNEVIKVFSAYEVFRILLPGFYFITMVKESFNKELSSTSWPISSTGELVLSIIASILIGGLLYSIDIPRRFKRYFTQLPSNLIKANGAELNIFPDESPRFYEELYFKYYESLDVTRTVKTEIQSGFFHLFFNIACTSALLVVFFYIRMCSGSLESKAPLLFGVFILVISIAGVVSIYKYKLRYSWKRHYDDFLEHHKNNNKENASSGVLYFSKEAACRQADVTYLVVTYFDILRDFCNGFCSGIYHISQHDFVFHGMKE